MKSTFLYVWPVILITLITGCADPLSTLIKDNHFYPIIPISNGHSVGDAYPDASINQVQPEVLLRVTDTTYRNQLMAKVKQDITLPTRTSEKKNDVTQFVYILGKASTALHSSGITKFRVSFIRPHQYVLPSDVLRDDVVPHVAKHTTKGSVYMVWGLLEVSEIEYSFYKQNGAKFEVKSGSKLEATLKTQLGTSWEVSSDDTLISREPRFIGYRLSEINIKKALKPAPTQTASSTKTSPTRPVSWGRPVTPLENR